MVFNEPKTIFHGKQLMWIVFNAVSFSAESREQRTFSSVFDPLDKLNHTLVHAYSTAKLLSSTRQSPRLEEVVLQV